MIKINEDRLLLAMAGKQLTLEGLAARAGVGLTTINRLRAGTSRVQAATLGKIADALDVKPEDIVTIDGVDL